MTVIKRGVPSEVFKGLVKLLTGTLPDKMPEAVRFRLNRGERRFSMDSEYNVSASGECLWELLDSCKAGDIPCIPCAKTVYTKDGVSGAMVKGKFIPGEMNVHIECSGVWYSATETVVKVTDSGDFIVGELEYGGG